LGKRSVRTVTLSPQDIELLRSAVDGYQKTYLGTRSVSSPSRNVRMRAYLRHAVFVLHGNVRSTLERDALAGFLRRLGPVVQVGNAEFMEYLVKPISRMRTYWSKGPSAVYAKRRHETDVDRDVDTKSMLLALGTLLDRLISQFQGQEPVLVDVENSASRRLPSSHIHLLHWADRLLESLSFRLRERESGWRKALRASDREARDLRWRDRGRSGDL
jgi:hypothetical protein